MEDLKKIEDNFIRTGVFDLSGFFKVNNEMNTKKCTFDAIPATESERRAVEYEKEKEALDNAWVDSVLK